MMQQRRIFATFLFTLVLVTVHPMYAQSSEPDGPRTDLTGAGRLIGSWVVSVDVQVSPDFTAMHTFHFGGTMSETTDLLAQGGEGPGHGTWERTETGYASTFELFIFNPDASPAGIIRVREDIRLVDENNFTGFAVADIILPDGTLIENIDNGPIQGKRVSVRRVKTEEYGSTPSLIWRGRAGR